MPWNDKNPTDNIKTPKTIHEKNEIYSPEKHTRFVKGLEKLEVDFTLRTLIAIALVSSARQG